MNVAEYLRKFLNEQPLQEAAVPGLGVFYNGLHEGKNHILFKEVPPVDKAFLNYFAFEENIGEEEAKAEIEKWVRKILSDLKGNGNVRIENVGAFDITSGKVVFTPTAENIMTRNQDFGLEAPAPAPAQDSAPVPAPTPVPEPKPVFPVNEERPRPNNQRRPLNPPVKRPQPNSQPTSSGKELLLGDRKKKPASPVVCHGNTQPFYTQWWFILICVLVVLATVLFGVRPVREKVLSVFKPKTTEMRVEEKVEEALNALVEDLDMTMEEQENESRVAAENAEIARQVKEGQEQKHRQEAQAKAQQAQAQPKPAAKPESKTTARPVAKPAQPAKTQAAKEQPAKTKSGATAKSVSVQKADIRKPVAGKFYLIVGGFAVEGNARNKCKEMRTGGYDATILYVEAKNMYYVSVKTCADKNEALKERAAFREKNVDCWIFAN